MVQEAVLATRLSVRRACAALREEAGAQSAESGAPAEAPLLLVALSGGADSLALAAAAAFEAPRSGLRAGAVIVDHGLQPGSAEVAAAAAERAAALGLAPVLLRRVVVREEGGGPEAAAREARYAALDDAAAEQGAAAVLTGHTRDDQAEQVLLGLARGSGLRSLAGIPERRALRGGALILRPFLAATPPITRGTTEAACAELGLDPWRDPHNEDAAFARVRVRRRVLPVLEAELGPGVAAALARTADLAREDAEALDALAEALAAELLALAAAQRSGGRAPASDPGSAPPDPDALAIPVSALAAQPPALRTRAIRILAARRFGVWLSREHVAAVLALVSEWRGQGPAFVPGLVVSRERGGRGTGAVLVLRGQRGSPRDRAIAGRPRR
ncbi:tRNA lysidine(34) synthetase TilS [Leucobacter massiliensis]|uniref:tRNA(Ile)-lysidine synthase n=1 Tax=Leucobacter massiliensis TaxID=1686285 RepID=A0A2S9QSP0_9MICO|nr:tRNA lysidine(34) synthetase TilS [Leucobacter massiliensis]PRI12613.1 tRNA lysidine(34) synthetase TilS [Leucobacter massiliensis]